MYRVEWLEADVWKHAFILASMVHELIDVLHQHGIGVLVTKVD